MGRKHEEADLLVPHDFLDLLVRFAFPDQFLDGYALSFFLRNKVVQLLPRLLEQTTKVLLQ